MKKYVFLLLLANIVFAGHASSFDIKGLQPMAPYGVFSAFSADSLKEGKYGTAIGFESAGSPDFYRFTGQFAYGISDTTEVGMTLHYLTQWEGLHDGFEDLAVGVKHRFLDEGKYGPSLAYVASVSIPSQNDAFTTYGSIGGGIILSKKMGPVKGHLNLFYSWPGSDKFKDDITLAAGLDFSAANNFKILSELYGKKSYSGKFDKLETRLGYRVITAENIFTTLGAAFSLDNTSPDYRISLSFTYLVPTNRKNIKHIYEPQD